MTLGRGGGVLRYNLNQVLVRRYFSWAVDLGSLYFVVGWWGGGEEEGGRGTLSFS